MSKQPKVHIREMQFAMQFHATMEGSTGHKVDMYFLWIGPEPDDGTVTFGVPHGRQDIAKFIFRSVCAGQRVLNDPQYPKSDDVERDFRP